MQGRENMLGRIREALRSAGATAAPPSRERVAPTRLDGVMPPIAAQDLLSTFEGELEKAAGTAYRASSRQELEAILKAILASSDTPRVILSRNPLLAQLRIAVWLGSVGKSVAVWPGAEGTEPADGGWREFKGAGFAAAVGITGVDFALAETGTLVLSSLTEGSQLVSLAPPVHVALYQRHQLVASLDEVLEKLPITHTPGSSSPTRSVVFITGTSRTADIEQILIRGVHGPRELHVILVEDSCLGPS